MFTFTTPFTLVFFSPTDLLTNQAKAIKTTKQTQEYVSTQADQIHLRGPPRLLFNL
jgi:hypothetical protein